MTFPYRKTTHKCQLLSVFLHFIHQWCLWLSRRAEAAVIKVIIHTCSNTNKTPTCAFYMFMYHRNAFDKTVWGFSPLTICQMKVTVAENQRSGLDGLVCWQLWNLQSTTSDFKITHECLICKVSWKNFFLLTKLKIPAFIHSQGVKKGSFFSRSEAGSPWPQVGLDLIILNFWCRVTGRFHPNTAKLTCSLCVYVTQWIIPDPLTASGWNSVWFTDPLLSPALLYTYC